MSVDTTLPPSGDLAISIQFLKAYSHARGVRPKAIKNMMYYFQRVNPSTRALPLLGCLLAAFLLFDFCTPSPAAEPEVPLADLDGKDFAGGAREMPMPEQRHLFAEGGRGMHHLIQPPRAQFIQFGGVA